MNVPREGAYFNCGVMLMNLAELRRQQFFESSVEFLDTWRGKYRFWDQSAINFLLQGQIEELPEYWNRASWRFDAQQNNDLNCVLHYTTSAPWLGGTRGPAQVLFERFAVDAGLPVDRQTADFKESRRQQFFRNAACTFSGPGFSAGVVVLQSCWTKREMCGVSEIGALLAPVYSHCAASAPALFQTRRANSRYEVQIGCL